MEPGAAAGSQAERPVTAKESARSEAGARTSPVRLVAVDLDGVVWLGGTVFPEAAGALAAVVGRGLELRYVTNNSTAHREDVSDRLAAAGLPAGAERVLTSGYVTGRWLRQRLPAGAPVLVVGEAGLVRELEEAGLMPFRAGADLGTQEDGDPDGAAPAAAGLRAPDPVVAGRRARDPDVAGLGSATPYQAVIVGMDRAFTFRSLARAQKAITAGALFVGTNQDPTFPTPAGLLPGAGAVVAAVATAAQQKPVFMGKPGLALAEILADTTRVPAAQTLFVGDRMSTDIGMGRRAGMITALVLTGVTSPADLERARAEGSPDLPHHVLATLADLPSLLDELGNAGPVG